MYKCLEHLRLGTPVSFKYGKFGAEFIANATAVGLWLGRIVALHRRSSTSYHIH